MKGLLSKARDVFRMSYLLELFSCCFKNYENPTRGPKKMAEKIQTVFGQVSKISYSVEMHD